MGVANQPLDPDSVSFNKALEVLLESLQELGAHRTLTTLGSGELGPAFNRALMSIPFERAYAWAKARGIPPVFPSDEPDGEMVGFAKASLPDIAKLKGVPWQLALKDWEPNQVARLAAFCHKLIDQVMENTYADPAEEIPF